MAISPIEINGGISRAQDYTTIKHNEDQKPTVDQTNYGQEFQREIKEKAIDVHKRDDPSNDGKKHDASQKGNGQYYGDGGKNRKNAKDDVPEEGKVVPKIQSGFDIRI